MLDSEPQKLVLIAPFLLFGLTAHEYAHAYTAYRLGDDTAAKAGRLSFNPLRHLDLIGALVLFLTNFIGWAKPVPINPRNFSDPKRDMSLVALAGPATNFFIAVMLALGFRFKIFEAILAQTPVAVSEPVSGMLFYGFLINLGLSIFNCIPVPPLDGYNVLSFFLPERLLWTIHRYHTFCFLGLIVLMATGVLGQILEPIYIFFATFLLGD
ncbi:MAG: site-2 protease family protein [Deltaproteobacteria bacterium]|jgi:Zn-dependent protease|nr:site-2 protease family protein [Deltaproteobacteria bacterium]